MREIGRMEIPRRESINEITSCERSTEKSTGKIFILTALTSAYSD